MFDFDMVIDLLRADGSIVVNKNLARNIGLDCAVLYSELASKYKYFKAKGQLTEDGFFFNTVDNLQFDTCLSDYQQREGIKTLKKLGLVDNRVRGLPAKRFFKVIPDMETLQKYLQPQEIQQYSSNLRTRNQKTKKLDIEKLKGNNTNVNNHKKNNNKKEKASSRRSDGANIVDKLTGDAKEVYRYFMQAYLDIEKDVHPIINNDAADKLNNILESEYIVDCDYDKELYIDKDALVEMIDLYFKTDYPLDKGGYADHKIYHFLSDGVLKNLYYKAVY